MSTAPVYILYFDDGGVRGHRIFTRRALAEAFQKEHPVKNPQIVERQAVAAAVAHLAAKEPQQ